MWRSWKIGDTIKYSWNDFDGKGSAIGKVIEVWEDDHVIVESDGMRIWVDDDNQDMFKKIN